MKPSTMGYLTVSISSSSKPKILQACVQIKENTKQLSPLNFTCPNCKHCTINVKITFDDEQPTARRQKEEQKPAKKIKIEPPGPSRTKPPAVIVLKNEPDYEPKREIILVDDPLRIESSLVLNSTLPCGMDKDEIDSDDESDEVDQYRGQIWDCRTCEQKFTKKVNLKRHETFFCSNNAKPDADVEVVSCEYCNAPFSSLNSLKSHITYEHNPKKAKECLKCSELFDTQTDLYAHMVERHGLIEHRCRYCPKIFSRKASCLHHEKIHPTWTPRLDEIDELFKEKYGHTPREAAAEGKIQR